MPKIEVSRSWLSKFTDPTGHADTDATGRVVIKRFTTMFMTIC